VQEIVTGVRRPRLVWQPIVDLRQGTVVGHEALARFGARLTAGPSSWFAAAAQSRDLEALEALLIRQALTEYQPTAARTFLSVNCSPAQLHSPLVLDAFDSTDLSHVVIELTEHVEFDKDGRLEEALHRLRTRGARLALDDVGAGWAGLRQLTELRPEIVKLDRSLVADADEDPVKQALAQMMLQLCSRLGSSLLVEGIETYSELDLFARMGVPYAQGFVFGRPNLTPGGVDDDLAVRLKFRAGMSRHVDKVAAHLDLTAPVCRDAGLPFKTTDVAGAGIGGDRSEVELDPDGRPVALRIHGAPRPTRRPVTTVLASEDLRSVARRAMTREHASRFDPLVCVDHAGRYVGVVHVTALVTALASS
jgi:EAL domain-containing protein (putative c-di-GMP-specific phosphodiesterase class I)